MPPQPPFSGRSFQGRHGIGGLALAAATALLSSCSTTTSNPSGFLGNERALGDSGRAETFDEAWVSAKFKEAPAYANYSRVFVAPVNTQYLAKQDWWEAQNPGKQTSMQEDAAKLAGQTRSEFEKAIRSHPGKKFGVTRRQGRQGTIDLEIAIVELVPAKAWFNAASTAAGFVVPGAGVLSAAVHAEGVVIGPTRRPRKACEPDGAGYPSRMVQLAELQKQADELSAEDRQGLLAYLLHGLTGAPEGADEEELLRREAEMDSGDVKPLSHREFVREVGRDSR